MSSIISQIQESGFTGTKSDLETTAKITVGSETSTLKVTQDSVELATDTEPDVELKLTSQEFSDLTSGKVLLSKSFIKGDLKPTGSTNGIMALVALFEAA